MESLQIDYYSLLNCDVYTLFYAKIICINLRSLNLIKNDYKYQVHFRNCNQIVFKLSAGLISSILVFDKYMNKNYTNRNEFIPVMQIIIPQAYNIHAPMIKRLVFKQLYQLKIKTCHVTKHIFLIF